MSYHFRNKRAMPSRCMIPRCTCTSRKGYKNVTKTYNGCRRFILFSLNFVSGGTQKNGPHFIHMSSIMNASKLADILWVKQLLKGKSIVKKTILYVCLLKSLSYYMLKRVIIISYYNHNSSLFRQQKGIECLFDQLNKHQYQ